MRYGHARDLLRDGDGSCGHDDSASRRRQLGRGGCGSERNSECYLNLIVDSACESRNSNSFARKASSPKSFDDALTLLETKFLGTVTNKTRSVVALSNFSIWTCSVPYVQSTAVSNGAPRVPIHSLGQTSADFDV